MSSTRHLQKKRPALAFSQQLASIPNFVPSNQEHLTRITTYINEHFYADEESHKRKFLRQFPLFTSSQIAKTLERKYDKVSAEKMAEEILSDNKYFHKILSEGGVFLSICLNSEEIVRISTTRGELLTIWQIMYRQAPKPILAAQPSRKLHQDDNDAKLLQPATADLLIAPDPDQEALLYDDTATSVPPNERQSLADFDEFNLDKINEDGEEERSDDEAENGAKIHPEYVTRAFTSSATDKTAVEQKDEGSQSLIIDTTPQLKTETVAQEEQQQPQDTHIDVAITTHIPTHAETDDGTEKSEQKYAQFTDKSALFSLDENPVTGRERANAVIDQTRQRADAFLFSPKPNIPIEHKTSQPLDFKEFKMSSMSRDRANARVSEKEFKYSQKNLFQRSSSLVSTNENRANSPPSTPRSKKGSF